ncbi:MAG: anaerobic ribonucleoside-triphosphate reductase activating protein [Muribaculaceae bacterium]|nr:anaerobic ribonucleoside-triphosphate reductase activating protein [Muribaculaceae bacterium]
MLRVVDIVDGTSVDGPGLRTSIYFAGCDHRCPGCHNPSTWDFNAGRDMTVDELMLRIIDNEFNVTFSGGDPLYQLEPLTALARAVKASGKTIWCYTGFIYEDLLAAPRYAEILSLIDVLVDGPFILALRDTDLLFRGSSNQRIIPLHPLD